MPKIEARPQSWGYLFRFHCPGCNGGHAFYVHSDGGQPSWSFNGDMQQPTFTPSLLVNSGPPPGPDGLAPPGAPDRVCHLFLTDGVLHFLPDCTHALAGQSVPLPEID
jgi:hypothetical protein